MIMLAKRKDGAVKYYKHRVITNVERVALMKALICSTNHHITKLGCLLEIFLTDKPLITKKNQSILLRLVTMLPSELECIKKLKANLLIFAGFKGGEDITVYLGPFWPWLC